MAIGYKYNSGKVLGFISTEGEGSTEPGDAYLTRYPHNYFNVSVCPIFIPHFIGQYLNACDEIYNHNRMRKSDLALEKYRVIHVEYFRLATTVALGMGITDGKILFCHII